MIPRALTLMLPILAAMLVAGCAVSVPRPVYCAEDFRPEMMEAVHVLPIVDARPDKKLKLNVERLQKMVSKDLTRKKYRVTVDSDRSHVDGLTEEDLREPPTNWMEGIGHSDSKWLMVLAVGDLSSKIVFGSTGNAEVTLVIMDNGSRRVVWRDKALGQAGQGGLLGMMMVSAMDDEALGHAMMQVMGKIPKKPRKD